MRVPIRLVPISCVVALTVATVLSPRVGNQVTTPTAADTGSVAAASTPPAGFSDTIVANVAAPTAMAWTPDGRMLVTGKAGRLMVLRDGGLRTVALDLGPRLCDSGERGLVGLAVDPEFATNHFVYLYFTHRVQGSCGGSGDPAPKNRVSRFVLGNDDHVDPSSETVIINHIVSPLEHHIAGDLEFGSDGYLYVSVGDGVCTVVGKERCGPVNNNSQLRRVPHGKILRVTRGGLPPSSNPYAGVEGARRCTRPSGVQPGTGPCKEIYASGFRNPFRFARKPGTSAFYVNDVGMDTWEEVDQLAKGRNYGWNAREGHCRRDSTTDCGRVAPYTNPIHDYQHGTCRSITGGAFVPTGVWSGYGGSYLYSDFACGKIFRLVGNPRDGFTRSTFLTGAEGPVHLRFGPYGDDSALYYLSYFGDSVHRVAQTRANVPPVADFSYVPDGRLLSFDGASSYDPDAADQVVSWAWDFGDGTSTVAAGPTVSHTYPESGAYEVRLVVTDTRGAESPVTVRTVHSGEHPPELSITGPEPTERFSVGSGLTLTAVATDAEDGVLPASAISWTVRRRHGNHFHPHLGPVTGDSVSTVYPAPEGLSSTGNSWLVATATATDSRGLAAQAEQLLLPRKVTLGFETSPTGARLVIEGESRIGPTSVVSWPGYVFPVRAPDQDIAGVRYEFRRWSDGLPRMHDIVTPAAPQSYLATFRRP